MDALFSFFSPGPVEMIVIGAIAVLLFGKRLPEVGRSVGRSLIEFKKGLNGIDDEPSRVSTSSPSYAAVESPESESPSAPQFTPPSE